MDPVGKRLFSRQILHCVRNTTHGITPTCPPSFTPRPHSAFCLTVVVNYLFLLTTSIHFQVDRVRELTTWSPTPGHQLFPSVKQILLSPPHCEITVMTFLVFSFLGNFHIRNGALMWRLNWLADVSARGMDNSFGLMMNYRYVLEDVDKNNQQYLLTGAVAASPQFLQPLQ